MKKLFGLSLLLMLFALAACGPSKTAEQIRALTAADYERLQKIVADICAKQFIPEGESHVFLNGSESPEKLRYLAPEFVEIGRSYAVIYLQKSPAGEDSIQVGRDERGVWTIQTHIGSWKNPPQTVWTSSREAM
ncbi:MAG: hypothetical protein NDI75_06325 [Candidatus Didemnitutus sp.]|nr:hypothetical protein [Candidatus Didemnitutus sp.]